MRHHIIIRVVGRFIIPFIFLFALYIQFHGEYSPGGGFQAGVIFAAAFVLYTFIFGLEKSKKVCSNDMLFNLAAIGSLLYAGVGVVCLFLGGNFLEYSILASKSTTGQQIGIIVIELGVGITVFSVMLLLFNLFVGRLEEK